MSEPNVADVPHSPTESQPGEPLLIARDLHKTYVIGRRTLEVKLIDAAGNASTKSLPIEVPSATGTH